MSFSFSICIPNFNYSKYIGQTIQSVLDQSYADFEIIVADNASTDGSVAVVQSFKDSRVRLVRNRQNIGFAPNLQRVTQEARREVLLLLSSDDVMKPRALETYAKALARQGERSSCTVLTSDIEVIDGAGMLRFPCNRPFVAGLPFAESLDLDLPSQKPCRVYRGREVLRDSLRSLRTFAPFLTIAYPRSLWERVEGYNCIRTVGPDKFFNYKLLAQDPDVVYVPEPLFQYRDHGSANFVAQQRTLKQQIDDYLNTIEYPPAFLESLGVVPGDLISEFIERLCLTQGLRFLAYGGYTQGFKMLMFALASYPGCTFRQPKTYALAALLALGPVGLLLARGLLPIWKRMTTEAELTTEESQL